jgi:hypothetical protein
MWNRALFGVCGWTAVAAAWIVACSSSSNTDTDGSGATGGVINLGGNGANGAHGGNSGSGASATDASAGSGNSHTGGTGGGYKWDGAAKDLDADWSKWPTTCGDSGVTPTPHPGGSPDCPDDLHPEGCPCYTEGQVGSCFSGERKNRNRGVCKDGVATCQRHNEFGLIWSACDGEMLPDPNATTGAGTCKCFTTGTWHIDNLSPCFWGATPGSDGANSTIGSGQDAKCADNVVPPAKPAQPWSTNSLTIDCAGHFRLCYALKAGDVNNPLPTDCTLAEVCTEGDYTTPTQEQQMPPLAAWSSTDSACAQSFANVRGYGEMKVIGMSAECDVIEGHSFHYVGYCPVFCSTDPPPDRPECKGCSNGTSGTF